MRVGGVLTSVCARRCTGVLAANTGLRFQSASLFSRLFFSSDSWSGSFKLQEPFSYVNAQELCKKRAPKGDLDFRSLVASKDRVFRDVTPVFSCFERERKVRLIRPGRWGKSVLGAAWIEYMRGRADLFVGTWAEKNMRKDKVIGVHGDLSNGGSSMGECVTRIMDAFNEGLELAEKVEGYGEKAKGRRLSVKPRFYPSGVEKSESDWTLPDCTSLVGGFLADLKRISNDAGRQVALFVDEYAKPYISALGQPGCNDMLKFFQDFYAKLKASTCVPFLFVTGPRA